MNVPDGRWDGMIPTNAEATEFREGERYPFPDGEGDGGVCLDNIMGRIDAARRRADHEPQRR